MTKKKKVMELATKGNLSRAEIARQVPCTPAYVTQTLGSVRPYKKPPFEKKPIPAAIEMCPGCEVDSCKRNGCLGA